MNKFSLQSFFKVVELLVFLFEDLILGMIHILVFVIFLNNRKIVDGKVNVDVAGIIIQIH